MRTKSTSKTTSAPDNQNEEQLRLKVRRSKKIRTDIRAGGCKTDCTHATLKN